MSKLDDEIRHWKRERNEMLRTLDIDAARNNIRGAGFLPPCDETLLLSLHKARYDCADIADELRLESGEWLRERGYGAMQGRDLEPRGKLPR